MKSSGLMDHVVFWLYANSQNTTQSTNPDNCILYSVYTVSLPIQAACLANHSLQSPIFDCLNSTK